MKNSNSELIIKDYSEINNNIDFDMFVCGHLKQIELITKKQYRKEIYMFCKKNNKKLYCFDDMSDFFDKKDFGKVVFYPKITFDDIPQNRFGKLRKASIPVLAVVGTSSKQGKYSIQILLKNEMEKRGCKVGFLASEPNGYLFGADRILHFGYGSNIVIGSKLLNVANEYIWEIEKLEKDIIICGCQSGMISYDMFNEKLLLFNQLYFLMGINCDGIILCVNTFDTVDYIERTINYISSITEAEIIKAIISDISNENTMNNEKEIINLFNMKNIKYDYLCTVNIEKLGNDIIDYYG